MKQLLTLISIALLASCTSNQHRIITEHSEEINSMLSKDEIGILELASMAPSGHNTQPWQVVIKKDGSWIIQVNEKSLLPAVDPYRRECLLSIGAFIQNLIYGAESLGYAADFSFLCTKMTDKNIACITIKESDTTHPEISEKIMHRRTVKSHHKEKAISVEDINFLKSLVMQEDPEVSFYQSGSQECQYIDGLQILSNIQQVNREDVQKELADWIRWDNKTIYNNRDGLNPDSLELTGIAKWFVQTFYNKNSVLTDSFKTSTMKKIEEMVSKHGGWMIISCQNDDPVSLLKTGMAFERIFLHVRELNIGLHPMTQPLEESPFNSNIKNELDIKGFPQFILRLGYIDDYPEPKSIRKSIDSFIKFE